MKSMKYISNQDIIFDNICNDISLNKKISVIKGSSGTGKSFLLNCIKSNFNTDTVSIFNLEGDFYLRSRDFYPFSKFINSMYINDQSNVKKKIITENVESLGKELGSWSPIGGDFLSACIIELFNTNKNKTELYNFVFDKNELDILFSLEYFCNKGKNIVFLIDDIQYWDEKSLRFLYTLIRNQDNKYIFLKNSQFIFTINTDYHGYYQELDGILKIDPKSVYNLDVVNVEHYQDTLKTLGLTVILGDDLVRTLYSITGGNLQISTDIILLLNNEIDIENTIKKIICEKNLGHLLIERLNKCNKYGEKMNETLKYASLFGSSFYYHDLEKILEKDESYIRNLIQIAQGFCLVKGTTNGASFIHELIREAYKNETKENKIKYYTKYSKCLKVLYPGNYKERAQSLKDAGEYEYSYIIYALELVKQLRLNIFHSKEFYKKLYIPHYLKGFILSMERAYRLFFKCQYHNCLSELESIEDIIPPILLAEKYYLLSITLSKWLDTSSRERAVKCLEPFLNLSSINYEIEIWERITSTYIIACIHNNDYNKARVYENKLKLSIGNRIMFDIDALYKLNIMRRKSSSLYSPKQAFILTKKSKNFFAPKVDGGFPLNPIEYYMSLNNFLATALMSGEFYSVIHETEEILSLPQKIKYLKFPRFEMPLNNAILIFYLNNKITANEACTLFLRITESYNTENSTLVILKVNLAIFHAIIGDFFCALKILEELYKKIEVIENLEFYYKYIIEVNLIPLKYLNGYNHSLHLLKKLESECISKGEEYFQFHVQSLIKAINDKKIINPLLWYNTPLDICNLTQENYWKYYGRKYLFGELEFWSES